MELWLFIQSIYLLEVYVCGNVYRWYYKMSRIASSNLGWRVEWVEIVLTEWYGT